MSGGTERHVFYDVARGEIEAVVAFSDADPEALVRVRVIPTHVVGGRKLGMR